METTRYITGHDDQGQAEIAFARPLTDGTMKHHPGFAVNIVWRTEPLPTIPRQPTEPERAGTDSVLQPRRGTVAMRVTFPPDSVTTSEQFDPAAAGAEFVQRLPDLAASFDPDGSGFHRTDTIDYGVVLEGEICLDLDNGRTTVLKAGDVVVQLGTRHAWRNPSDRPAQMFFVLIGAARG